MNLYETFNNKHLDFKQGPPGNVDQLLPLCPLDWSSLAR